MLFLMVLEMFPNLFIEKNKKYNIILKYYITVIESAYKKWYINNVIKENDFVF